LNKGRAATLLVFVVLIIDQVSKVLVKTNMYLGQEFNVLGDWFRIHFIENDGMAFGLEFGGQYGKLILSVFRIICIGFIIYMIRELVQRKAQLGIILSLSLILAGAIGNMIDSAVYGLIFSESFGAIRNISEVMPEGGGYAGFLQGRVVDMLYFPLVDGFYPEWMGGKYFIFFRPVFNIADSAITLGVTLIFLFYRSFFMSEPAK